MSLDLVNKHLRLGASTLQLMVVFEYFEIIGTTNMSFFTQ